MSRGIPSVRRNPIRHLWAVVLAITGVTSALGADAPPVSAEALEFFEARVRPLLIEHCYECHSVESGESSGELLLDSAAGLRRGGTHGPVLVPGKPAESLLVQAIAYDDPELQMPPEGKLDADAIAVLKQWIEMGAPDPRDAPIPTSEVSPIDRDPRSHWAFVAPKFSPPPPQAIPAALDPLDVFAATAAATQGIEPNELAGDETIVRRLYFDLTGLPPSRAEVEAYVKSQRPDRYQRLVDQLLASPDFAERFARHWLDVARYADTVGYALAGKERRYKGSHRYRDWTIDAFANDMPYDEMLRHQLAGDRTDPNNDSGNLDAMGFLTLGRKFLNPHDTIDDRIDVITRGLLGMTVSCARCHDHKFDPIPTSDYYSLAGIIFSSETPEEGASPLMMVDKSEPADTAVLIRGQPGNRGPLAPRQFLTSLRKQDEPRFTDGSGRWELVQRITAADNPLTARVMVNRLWDQLIGKPLVDSPSDFGFRTEPPAIPEILDNLAVEFAEHWSIKRTVRRIVLTRIYRQSGVTVPENITADPDNQWLGRANRRRRDFESLRDSLLCVAGSLHRTIGGEPVEITLSTPAPRRTIYAMIDRQNLPSLFRTFDFASPDAHSPGRYYTTVPQQALFLLNNEQSFELARRTADVIRATAESDDVDELTTRMFEHVLARPPSGEERLLATEFLRQPERPLEPELDPRRLWSYGTATIDERQQPTDFAPLGVFQSNRWQSAAEQPAPPPLSYAFLDRENGHTPHDPGRAVVRRFTAPFAGTVRIRGQLGHRNKEGDGVHTSIWIGGKRRFDSVQKSNNRPYGPIEAPIEAGQSIDLVASPGASDSFDSFYWRASIVISSDDGRHIETDSVKHFSGPLGDESRRSLDRLAQLAQILVMSNEFAFVD